MDELMERAQSRDLAAMETLGSARARRVRAPATTPEERERPRLAPGRGTPVIDVA